MAKIKVALVGVGNCASSLVQALHHYGGTKPQGDGAELAHPILGSYKVVDIEVVAAFDVDKRKVSKDLGKAIFAEPNNAPQFTKVPPTKIIVQRGPTLDGIAPELEEMVLESKEKPVDVAAALKKSGANILVCLLPGGAREAVHFYAEESLKAGVAFINTTPVLLASETEWAKRYTDAKIPIVGDDLMSQLGATALHKALLAFLSSRGARIVESYQLDVGGGTESLDALHRARDQKRTIKSRSVSAEVPYDVPVTAGSTDFVYFLKNRRESWFSITSKYCGGAELVIDMRLISMDAPNSTSILFDVIRGVKIGLDRGLSGPIEPVCAYGFKAPPFRLYPLEISEAMFDHFIRTSR